MENMMISDEALENANGGAARINYDTGKYILYTVVRNDCLSMIAFRFNCTLDIVYAINRQVIGPDINMIRPGMVLRIPTL